MRFTLRVGGTVVTLYFWLTTVYGGFTRSAAFTGWWILSATVGAAILLLIIWWPHRKDSDRDQPR